MLIYLSFTRKCVSPYISKMNFAKSCFAAIAEFYDVMFCSYTLQYLIAGGGVGVSGGWNFLEKFISGELELARVLDLYNHMNT